MKKRIGIAVSPAGPSCGKKGKRDLRNMRLNLARMIRAEDLVEQEIGNLLNLLLADEGALADEEFEPLYEYLMRKNLKK